MNIRIILIAVVLLLIFFGLTNFCFGNKDKGKREKLNDKIENRIKELKKKLRKN